jgi:hypothetical protein
MKVLTLGTLVAVTITVAMAGGARAQNNDQGRHCDTTTLRGPYVFAASGFNIVAGVAQPKAIVELIDFHGDGSLTVTGGTVTINGVIAQIAPNGAGNYTLDPDCNGTLAFIGGPSFNIFIGDGKSGWMIQNNPNSVFQGTLTRRR